MKQAKVTFLTKRVDELRIHPVAQRETINRSKIENFKQNLNLDAVGTIHVVRYPVNGEAGSWVVDGQHRIVALQELALGELVVNICLHHEIRDDAGAARLFLDLNNRTPVTTFDKFKNELTAGNPEAVKINRIAEEHGLKISSVFGKKSICCISAAKKLAARDIFDATLSFVHATWGREKDAHEGQLLLGVGEVLASFNGDLDRDALSKKLAKSGGPSAILGKAKGRRAWDRGSLATCVARVIVDEYNKGRSVGKIEL